MGIDLHRHHRIAKYGSVDALVPRSRESGMASDMATRREPHQSDASGPAAPDPGNLGPDRVQGSGVPAVYGIPEGARGQTQLTKPRDDGVGFVLCVADIATSGAHDDMVHRRGDRKLVREGRRVSGHGSLLRIHEHIFSGMHRVRLPRLR